MNDLFIVRPGEVRSRRASFLPATSPIMARVDEILSGNSILTPSKLHPEELPTVYQNSHRYRI